MSFQIRPPSSELEFQSYYDLRFRILREPWNQPRGSEKDEFEDAAFHLGAWDSNGRLLGVGRLHQATDRIGQIRYMAVEPCFRNRGCGQAILSRLEAQARNQCLLKIILNARKEALGFYQRAGYQVIGPAHNLFDSIPHFQMSKQL